MGLLYNFYKLVLYNQKLNYLHWNTVTEDQVNETWHWKCSRTIDYFTNNKGLINLVILDGFLGAEISNKEVTRKSSAPLG